MPLTKQELPGCSKERTTARAKAKAAADSSASLRNDNQKSWQRQGLATAKAAADSSASLRNDNQKSGQRQGRATARARAGKSKGGQRQGRAKEQARTRLKRLLQNPHLPGWHLQLQFLNRFQGCWIERQKRPCREDLSTGVALQACCFRVQAVLVGCAGLLRWIRVRFRRAPGCGCGWRPLPCRGRFCRRRFHPWRLLRRWRR